MAAAVVLAACSGGGGGDGSSERTGLSGTWTYPCSAHDAEWRAETVHFDEPTGTVTHARLRFVTPDCSDPGVVIVEETGEYSTGQTIDCASGSESRCTELDMVWGSGSRDYGVYSVDDSGDPDLLFLSHLEGAPTQRPADVDPSNELRRISFPGKYGHAILDLYLVDGGFDPAPPQPLTGYALLPYDLNEGSGGHYIWLYYQMGRADGADGTPLGEIYTVDQQDGESPRKGGTQLPVNLNAGLIVGHELWLYKRTATDAIMRCIVVANPTDGVTRYGPPEAQGEHAVVWVEELLPDSLKSPWPSYPPDVQDLNEGEGVWTDYLYLGYCADR